MGALMSLDARVPSGPIERKWERCKFESKLVNPANKRRFTVLVVGSGFEVAAADPALVPVGLDGVNEDVVGMVVVFDAQATAHDPVLSDPAVEDHLDDDVQPDLLLLESMMLEK